MDLPVIISIPKDKFVLAFITLLKGTVKDGLTEAEVKLLEQIILKYLELKTKCTDEDLLNKILFDPETKNEIKEILNWSNQNFNNYFRSLKDKKLFIQKNEKLYLNPFIVPHEKITFQFKLK